MFGSAQLVWLPSARRWHARETVLRFLVWGLSEQWQPRYIKFPDILKYLHLRSGWELELPEFPTPFRHGSTAQNLQHALNLFARGQIQAAPLRSPLDAETALLSLLNEKETCHSVVFDWNSIK